MGVEVSSLHKIMMANEAMKANAKNISCLEVIKIHTSIGDFELWRYDGIYSSKNSIKNNSQNYFEKPLTPSRKHKTSFKEFEGKSHWRIRLIDSQQEILEDTRLNEYTKELVLAKLIVTAKNLTNRFDVDKKKQGSVSWSEHWHFAVKSCDGFIKLYERLISIFPDEHIEIKAQLARVFLEQGLYDPFKIIGCYGKSESDFNPSLYSDISTHESIVTSKSRSLARPGQKREASDESNYRHAKPEIENEYPSAKRAKRELTIGGFLAREGHFSSLDKKPLTPVNSPLDACQSDSSFPEVTFEMMSKYGA